MTDFLSLRGVQPCSGLKTNARRRSHSRISAAWAWPPVPITHDVEVVVASHRALTDLPVVSGECSSRKQVMISRNTSFTLVTQEIRMCGHIFEIHFLCRFLFRHFNDTLPKFVQVDINIHRCSLLVLWTRELLIAKKRARGSLSVTGSRHDSKLALLARGVALRRLKGASIPLLCTLRPTLSRCRPDLGTW